MKGRKGLALAILSKMPKPGKEKGEDSYEDTDEDEGAGKEAAGKALCRAIEDKDYAGIADAVADLVAMAE